MSNDPEYLPPTNRQLSATRPSEQNVAAHNNLTVAPPRTVVSSWITGLQARMEARSNTEIAASIRARTDAINASTELGGAMQRLRQKAHELEELPDILSQDRTRRTHERTEERAEMRYEAEERQHKETLAVLRRQQELADARRKLAEAAHTEQVEERTLSVKLEHSELLAQQDLAQIKRELKAVLKELGAEQDEGAARKTLRRELESDYNNAIAGGDHTRAAACMSILDGLEALEKEKDPGKPGS